jgi:hypothetical protein
VTDGADRPLERPIRGDLGAKQLTSQILTHAGCVSSGQDQPIELIGYDLGPRKWRPKRCVRLHVGIKVLGFGGRAELPEDHAVEQPLIGAGCGAALLGGEAHHMAKPCQQPPRHRHLGHVKVVVRYWDQNGGDHPTLEEPIPVWHL